MINLNSLPSYSVGRLTRVSPRKDADGGLGALFWDIEICFDIRSKSEAEVIDAAVPGALAVYSAGQTGSKGEAKDSSEYDVIRCSIWAADAERRRVASSHAEIRQSIVRCKGPISVYLIRMRLHGLITKFAVNICAHLDSEIVVYVDSAKNSQIDSMKDAEIMVSAKNAGSLLLSSDGECYIVKAESVDRYEVSRIDGTDHNVPKSSVEAIMKLSHSYQETSSIVASYCAECISSGSVPVLANIVGALAKKFVGGDVPPSAGWEIDSSVIESAVEIGLDSAVENVEPADA